MEQALSLSELNGQIKDEIALAFSQNLWLRAEISELHENASGHAYFELIEKDSGTDRIIAKNRATCWANIYRMLKPYFEGATGEPLRRGLNVMLLCHVEYHELYGISLNIRDIEPSFTMGDMARQRQQILRRLQEDGVMDMNRELLLSPVPQRIAVISSATAAGYGDFINQLQHNAGGFAFSVKLFPAAMQGEQAAESIVAALENIYEQIECFDAVAIIRGGGATAELSCFDSYDLAFHCAQFPLPVVTGIGHERDESVLDIIAHTRCKTPTAAAEFFIGKMQQAAATLTNLQNAILALTEERLQHENNRLQNLPTRLATAARHRLTVSAHRLALFEQSVQLSSPETLLKRGFALVSLNGKLIKTAAELEAGSRIETHFCDGKVWSVVE